MSLLNEGVEAETAGQPQHTKALLNIHSFEAIGCEALNSRGPFTSRGEGPCFIRCRCSAFRQGAELFRRDE